MWRQIRGMGLSYHYSMRCLIEAGYISFNLFRAAQVVQAFEEAKKIMVRTSVSGHSLHCALLCVCGGGGGGARAFMVLCTIECVGGGGRQERSWATCVEQLLAFVPS